MLLNLISQITAKWSLLYMNNATNFHQQLKIHTTGNHLMQFSNNLPLSCRHGHKEATSTSHSNSEPQKSKQSYAPCTYTTSLGGKLSLLMTSSHHERPCYTRPVWVFFACIRLREITLKMLSFLQQLWHLFIHLQQSMYQSHSNATYV